MAIPGSTSALIAAFVFGIVVNAASAGLFLNIKGHGSSIFRDGKRLVLALFLLSAALWAQTDFITTLIDPTATESCQVGVIFTTTFDQLARFSIEQHLLWVISDGLKPGALHYTLQASMAARFVLGAVFVGLTRSEFNTVCVPLSSVLVVAIITVIADTLIILGLAGLAISAGVFGKLQDGGQAASHSKAIVAVLAGLVVWLGISVPMSLGIPGSDYLTRSTLPAGGLAILIIIVAAGSDSLVMSKLKRDQERRLPEAPSPRMITTARSISTSGSNDYPPSRFEDLKTEQLSSLTAFVQPREVPHPGQPVVLTQRFSQNLPTISNATAGQGVGGLPVQGALFPPMRANTEPVKPVGLGQTQQEQSKRSIFDSSKGPAKSVAVRGKLAISNPVLQQGGSNPLDKVATTDLATAAQMDKERRAMMALHESTKRAELSANPLGANPDRGLAQTTSTTRKEVPAAPFKPSPPDNEAFPTGSATGAQLSPSGEELRRRSPRQVSPKSSMDVQAESRSPPVPAKSPGRPKPQQVTAPYTNATVRPSRQRPSSPEPEIEPSMPPLQRRPTAGLPPNSRSRSVRRPSPPGMGENRQETVLFVNDIVYDDPKFVASVMEDAKDRKVKPARPSDRMSEVETLQDEAVLVPQVRALPEPPATATSIVHRPRPIPRKPSKEDSDAFYPPTGHKKSRSLGNILHKKSILQSSPGSPTKLPPLPPPPMSMKNERPHPNDTKSMTYSEKVKYLFPALEGAGRIERRSSVPDMPPSFMDDSATLTDNEARDMGDRFSKRTTGSIRTHSIFSEQDQGTQREMSMATYRGLVNEAEVQEQDQQQGSPRQRSSRPNGTKRASSPVLPIFGDLRSASTADYEDDVTNIGSVYSPRHVQHVGLTVHQARAIEVTRMDRPSPDNRGVSALTNGEEMTIMLDSSVARDIQNSKILNGSNSPVYSGSPVEEATSTSSSGPWHRRVGETSLSFSGHSDKRGSKRGPPPTPLALSDRPTQAKQAAIAQAAEPSPLPSPGEALQLIQAQLKKYEHADRASIESPGRQALLNDLEAEMGQQESQWLGMQNRFTQDSVVTLDLSPTLESRRTSAAIADVSSQHNLSRNSSTRSIMAAERSMYRRTRQTSIASSIISLTNDGDDLPLGSRASLWQKRLAAAHQEYMHTAGELDRKRSRNFLTLSPNLGSPSPPDSDESETEIEGRRNLKAVLARRAKENGNKKQNIGNILWTKSQPQEELTGLLWVRPEKPYHVPVVEPPLPGLDVRPAQRKESSELRIESNQLWQKPASDKPFSSSKLWFTAVEVEEPEEISTTGSAPPSEVRNFYNPGIRRSQVVSGRPLTQRPPRRSKRITVLPDIIEDPVPLPDKRGTLGIFQFPWGEKSDVASLPQRPAFAAMPGTMSTAGFRDSFESRSLELEQTEYSSSFFDEYEEDDDDDSDSMGSESDDGFDETTLFEIASLLKASNVPSTNSFFGNPRDSGDSLLDQYMSEDQRSSEPPAGEYRNLAALEEEMDEMQKMSSQLPPRRTQSLWDDSSDDEEAERGSHGKGLPQPEDWHRYDESTETVRSRPRLSQQPAFVDSDSLWAQQPVKISTSTSPLWMLSDSPIKPSSSEPLSQDESSSLYEYSESNSTEDEASPEASASSSPLWQAHEQPQRGQHGVGLPQPESFSDYDGAQLTARPKPRYAEPAAIESFSLWAAPEPKNSSMSSEIWILEPKAVPVEQPASPTTQADLQSEEFGTMLWSEPAPPKQETETGLFSVNSGRTDFRNTTQAPAAVHVGHRAQSPVRQPLDRLTSSTLWVTPAVSEAPRNWLLAEASPSFPKRLLWSAPASPSEIMASGLFDPKVVRSDFRTTSQTPAAFESNRRPRSPELKSLDRLTSTALWTSAPEVKRERNWISIKAATSPKKMLWSAPASPKELAGSGLFTKAGRTDFRTTSTGPAAIETDRKRRPMQDRALEQIDSTSLWVSDNTSASERDWIATSSASGPSTPSTLRGAFTPETWQKALEEAVAASYPVRQIATRKAPIQSSPLDWAAALNEAVAKSYNSETAFDASKRHPVFAASSLVSNASIIHPAAIGYTSDVATVHPVFFGSGAGKPVHPAVRAQINTESRPFATPAPDNVEQVSLQSSVAPKPRGRRITAMASMFEDADQNAPGGRSFSVNRSSSIRRTVTPPRPATPELSVENTQESNAAQQYEMDPALLAQIEALEQERLFAEQWAAGAFESPEIVSEPTEGPLEPSPVIVAAIKETPAAPTPNQLSDADHVAKETSTPLLESPAPILLEAKTYKAPSTPVRQQAISAEDMDGQIFTPVDVTPSTQLAPLTLPVSETKTPKTPAAQPTTPKSAGWFSSVTARLGGRSPPQVEQPPVPQISQLQRSNTVTSTVSALSDSDTITLRDSLISVDSERGKQAPGSKIQFRY